MDEVGVEAGVNPSIGWRARREDQASTGIASGGGPDLRLAMTSLGFENYSEALKIYLSRYREVMLL